MKILYKNRAFIGLRYPYSFPGVSIRIMLLIFYFAATYFLAIGRLNWENWSVAIFFICGIMVLTINRRKAVYNENGHQLTLYNTSFDLRGTTHQLPGSKEELIFHVEQRIDYQNTSGRQQVLQFTDLWLKLPQESIQLDTASTNDSLRGEIRKDWEQFFAAIYDPELKNAIPGSAAFYYLELGTWIAMILAGIAGLYINLSS